MKILTVEFMENDESLFGNLQMRSRFSLRSGTISALACYAASAGIAVTLIVLNHNFGLGDISSFLYLSLPFAFLVGSISFLFPERLFNSKPLTRYLYLAALGAVMGALWSTIVSATFGPWFRAFSFSVLPCWIGGGAIGLLSGSRSLAEVEKQSSVTKFGLILITFAIVLLGAQFGPSGATKPQRLEVVWAKRIPGPSVLTIDDYNRNTFTQSELKALRAKGVTGRLTVSGISVHGEGGKNTRALIIMEKQLAKEVDLAQPDGTNIVYLQQDDKWEMLPSDAPTLKRKIHLEVSTSNRNETSYWAELAMGGRQGGIAFVWE
jgi:hypothetical protein